MYSSRVIYHKWPAGSRWNSTCGRSVSRTKRIWRSAQIFMKTSSIICNAALTRIYSSNNRIYITLLGFSITLAILQKRMNSNIKNLSLKSGDSRNNKVMNKINRNLTLERQLKIRRIRIKEVVNSHKIGNLLTKSSKRTMK